MKKRAVLSMFLIVALSSGVLSGCQDAIDPNALQVRSSQSEKTILTLFMPIDLRGSTSSVYRDVISAYNKQSETVELRVDGLSTADGFNEALQQRLDSGGEGADLFVVNADWVKPLNAKGYFYDLSGLSAYNMLTDAAREQSIIGDTVYTIPICMTAYGMYVNVGLLKQYGLEPPQNIEEFMRCCQVLKENGIVPLGLNRWYAMTAPTLARGLYPIYQAENRNEILAGLNDGSIPIGDYMVNGFRFFAELIEKGYYGDGLTAAYTDSIKAVTSDFDDFTAGKVAFGVFVTGQEKNIEQAAPDMEFIQQGFPVMPDGTVSLPTAATRLCVNAKGAHVEEALNAVEYMTSVKASDFVQEGSGFIPAIEDSNPPAVDPRVKGLFEDAASPGQVPIEDMTLHFTYWDTVRELCLKIIDGMSPEEAAQEYNRIQQEQIKAYTAR